MDIAHAVRSTVQMTRRIVCLARGGHDLVMQFEKDLLSLRCLACDYRTHGWVLDEGRPRHDATVVRLPTAQPIRGPRAA